MSSFIRFVAALCLAIFFTGKADAKVQGVFAHYMVRSLTTYLGIQGIKTRH